MKTQQLRHNLLQLFFYMAICAMGGFTAVFLQYKGLSNSIIGIVSGAGSFGIILVTPLVNRLITQIPWLTVKRALYLSFLILILAFGAIALIPMPLVLLSVIFAFSNILLVSVLPLSTLLPMEYIRTGHELNYGVARSFGSIGYAVSAIIFGRCCQFFNPNILAAFFVVSAIGLLLSLHGIIEVRYDASDDTEQNTKSAGTFQIFTKYPLLGKILIGYLLMFGAAICLGTYLINIVRAVGGNTTIYGIAVFFASGSEMPAMAIVPRLLKKHNSLNLMKFAGICYILRNGLISLAPNIPVVFLGSMMQGLSYAILSGVLTYYITDHVAPEDQMAAQSLTIIVTSGIGATIGNLLGGFLQDWFGLPSVFLFSIVMTIIGCILLLTGKESDLQH